MNGNWILGREQGGDAVWVGDLVWRRHVEDPKELEGLVFWITKLGGDANVREFADLRVLGVDIATVSAPAPVQLDYDRFVKDVVSGVMERIPTLRFEVQPKLET